MSLSARLVESRVREVRSALLGELLHPSRGARRALAIAAAILLLALYVWGAMRQATRVNTDVQRGDQRAYLAAAERLRASGYADLGDRNRMPLYPALQSVFLDPSADLPAAFERAKRVSTALSVALLLLLAGLLRAWLPGPETFLALVIAAFTVFVMKAGWVQADLLFYVVSFAAWLALVGAARGPSLRAGALAGLLCGLAYLTKATMLAPAALWIVVSLGTCAVQAMTGKAPGARRRLASIGAVIVMALAVTSPYLAQNHRIYGRWFYNVNTTFAMWCDSWEEYKEGPRAHGAMQHWPDLPPEKTPSAARYLRSHTAGQILSRLAGGSREAVQRAARSYGYFEYAVLLAILAAGLLASNRAWAADLLKREWPAIVFIAVYFPAMYLSVAWYVPIAAGNRFLLAAFLPFLWGTLLVVARCPKTCINGRALAPIGIAVLLGLLLADIPLRLLPQTGWMSGGH